MALALSLLTDNPSTANATSYASSAVTPAGSSGILVAVGGTATTAETPTLDSPSWLSGAWTQEETAVSGALSATLFSGKAVASPSSAAVTASFVGGQTGCCIQVIQ